MFFRYSAGQSLVDFLYPGDQSSELVQCVVDLMTSRLSSGFDWFVCAAQAYGNGPLNGYSAPFYERTDYFGRTTVMLRNRRMAQEGEWPWTEIAIGTAQRTTERAVSDPVDGKEALARYVEVLEALGSVIDLRTTSVQSHGRDAHCSACHAIAFRESKDGTFAYLPSCSCENIDLMMMRGLVGVKVPAKHININVDLRAHDPDQVALAFTRVLDEAGRWRR